METQLARAIFTARWATGREEPIPVKYNPKQLVFEKGVQLAEIPIPGLDSPLQQFVRGQAEKLTVELFFDTTDSGMGPDATSVTIWTDRFYQFVKVEPSSHAPPICTFVWGRELPGSHLGDSKAASSVAQSLASNAGKGAAPAKGADGATLGNQRRYAFQCVVENVRQQFTLFNSIGVPLRATLTVTLREYLTLDEQLEILNLSSPDRTHRHALERHETLTAVATRFYGEPGAWRPIALANGISDPRRLVPGRLLTVPRLEPETGR